MLESRTSMNTSGLTHPRPRTSETEGLVSHSGNPLVDDVQDEVTDHGNSGNAWGTYLQVSAVNTSNNITLDLNYISCLNLQCLGPVMQVALRVTHEYRLCSFSMNIAVLSQSMLF